MPSSSTQTYTEFSPEPIHLYTFLNASYVFCEFLLDDKYKKPVQLTVFIYTCIQATCAFGRLALRGRNALPMFIKQTWIHLTHSGSFPTCSNRQGPESIV